MSRLSSPRLLPLLLLLAVLTSACGQALGDPAVAAVINDEEIAVAELRPYVVDTVGVPNPATGEPQTEAQATNQALSELSLLTLLSQELGRLGGQRIDEAAVDALFAQAVGDAGGEEAFQASLEGQGITTNRVRLDLAFQATIDGLVAQLSEDFAVTEEDVQFRYSSAYGLPTVSHVLVATEDEARTVLDRLAAGEAFADVAAEVSTDPGSAAAGGSLGPLQIGAFVPEFEEAALALAPGEISEPVETQFGFHIITTGAAEPLTVELRAQITDELKEQGVQQDLSAVLTRLLDEAEARVNPRFGVWAPAFGVNGGLSQIIAPSSPLGDLQPVQGLEPALEPALGGDPAPPLQQ